MAADFISMNATVALTLLHTILPLVVQFGPFAVVVVVPLLLLLLSVDNNPDAEFDLGNIRTLCTFPYLN